MGSMQLKLRFSFFEILQLDHFSTILTSLSNTKQPLNQHPPTLFIEYSYNLNFFLSSLDKDQFKSQIIYIFHHKFVFKSIMCLTHSRVSPDIDCCTKRQLLHITLFPSIYHCVKLVCLAVSGADRLRHIWVTKSIYFYYLISNHTFTQKFRRQTRSFFSPPLSKESKGWSVSLRLLKP